MEQRKNIMGKMDHAVSSLTPKAVIFGCAGTSLTLQERAFFKTHQPLGFIVFARNIDNPEQVKLLITELKSTVAHKNPPILIDQEGGRVARLQPPHWKAYPAATIFGDMAAASQDLAKAKAATYENFSAIAQDLKELGITVDCAPLLDLQVEGSDQIIGDRSFSSDPKITGTLGLEVMRALEDQGIASIIKHVPTHGPADCDSHLELPRVTLTHQELKPHFEPFRMCQNAPWAMTAHIIYDAFDPENPATQSRLVINDIIRGEIGFQGILVSDDIGMKALSGTFKERAQKALRAGCDIVLHCSGDMDEMRDTVEAISGLTQQALAKLEVTHGIF